MMRLDISRPEAEAGVAALAALYPEDLNAECQLYVADGQLIFDMAGNTVSMEAKGEWRGVVRAAVSFFVKLNGHLPAGDSLVLSVIDGRLHLGSTSIECVIQETMERGISVPIGASLADLLLVHLSYPENQIKAAGLERTIEEARVEANKCVDGAAEHLRPLGIGAEEIADFVSATLQRR